MNWLEWAFVKWRYKDMFNALNGYVTYIMAIAGMLTGLGLCASGIADLIQGNQAGSDTIQKGWLMFIAAGAVFGIGRKVQKVITALKENGVTK